MNNCLLRSSVETTRLSRLIERADTEDIFSFVLFASSLSSGDDGDAFVEHEGLFSGLFMAPVSSMYLSLGHNSS
jgi:hypothetical protein